MSFLSISNLKKAYESLGEEITRTFDSSNAGTEGGQGEDQSETQVGVRCVTRGRVSHVSVSSQVRASPPHPSGPPQPPATAEPVGQEEEWGQWEEQKKPATAAPSARYRKHWKMPGPVGVCLSRAYLPASSASVDP